VPPSSRTRGIDLEKSEAWRIVLDPDMYRETLRGVQVCREDIEALGVELREDPDTALVLVPRALIGSAPARDELQWPWDANPSLYGRGGKEVKRIQNLLDEHLDPSMQNLTLPKMRRELEKHGIRDVSDSGLQRALGRKV
jgi:hypothetical protein